MDFFRRLFALAQREALPLALLASAVAGEKSNAQPQITTPIRREDEAPPRSSSAARASLALPLAGVELVGEDPEDLVLARRSSSVAVPAPRGPSPSSNETSSRRPVTS